MSVPSVFEISDPISQSFSDCEKGAATFKAQADLVSKDIKEIEDRLRGLGTNLPFKGPHYGTIVPIQLRAEDHFDAVGISCIANGLLAGGRVVEIFERLSWEPQNENGPYRLMYSRREREGIATGLPVPDNFKHSEEQRESLSERKPLIETRLQTRLRMHRMLPQFLRLMGGTLHYAALNELPQDRLRVAKVGLAIHFLIEVWGSAYKRETQYLRVYMGHLRRKLKEDPSRPRLISTEPGVGYRLRLSEK